MASPAPEGLATQASGPGSSRLVAPGLPRVGGGMVLGEV